MRKHAKSAPTIATVSPRTQRKRQAILEVASELFLQKGYLGTSMDEIAEQARISKQTAYKHFASKEALFVAIVSRMTNDASDRVRDEVSTIGESKDPARYLKAFAERQLAIVLTPQLMRLRRLVIAEADRFPELGRALFSGGPGRAVETLTAALEQFKKLGLLKIGRPRSAASQFNWLVMGQPVNAVMFLGDDARPSARELRRHAAEAVSLFLAAYGPSH